MNNVNVFSVDLVDYSVFAVNTAGPVTRQTVLQRFRLSYSLPGRTLNVPNERVYSFQCLFVRLLPVPVVFPIVLREYEIHSANVRGKPPPPSTFAMDFRSLVALFGLLSR